MKTLITGVNGFIATNMAHYYVGNTKHEIVGLSKNTHASYGHRDMIALANNNPRFKYLQCDLLDSNKLWSILDREAPDQIIHMAAEADVSRSFEYPYDYLKTNLEGTLNILEWIRRNTDTRMVHFSTDEVFGEPDHRSLEEEVLCPKNPYSASKAATEQYVNAYNACFGTQVQMVRPVNNYGPYQGTNRLISKTIIRCLEDEPFHLFAETKKHTRWWIYVEDTCRAVDMIIRKGEKTGIYNVTSDTEMGVEDTVMYILDKLEKKSLLQGYNDFRPRDDENYALDGTKLKKLGWKEKYTFEDGIRQTIEWYRKNINDFQKR